MSDPFLFVLVIVGTGLSLAVIGVAVSNAGLRRFMARPRECSAMLLVHDITEVCGHCHVPTFGDLREMAARALADAEPKVRYAWPAPSTRGCRAWGRGVALMPVAIFMNGVTGRYAALRSVALMMTMLSDLNEVMHFQALVPTVLTVIQQVRGPHTPSSVRVAMRHRAAVCVSIATAQAVATADDDVVVSALDAFADIAEGTSSLLAPYTNELCTCVLQLLMNRAVDLPVTECAAQVVINLITTRPKAMIKAGVVPQVMSTALQMAMNYDEEEHKELHASGTPPPAPGRSAGVSVSGVAERILDTVAIAVPSMCVAATRNAGLT